MIEPGIYEATVKDYAIQATKAGDPKIAILFETVEKQETVFWNGYVHTEKSKAMTIKSLVILGFKGHDISVLTEGAGNGALDTSEVHSITVIHDPDQNDPNKMWPKVSFINDPNYQSFQNVMEKKEVVMKCQGLNLAGEFASLRAEQNKNVPTNNLKNEAPQTTKSGAGGGPPEFDKNESMPNF